MQTKLSRAALVCMALLFALVLKPTFLIQPVRALVATVAWPIERVFSATAFEIRGWFGFFTSIGSLKSENERLTEENRRLMVANVQERDVSKENDELRKEIGLIPRGTYDLAAATVIDRDESGLGNWVTIDQGFVQGIRKTMPVIVGNGVLAGRVGEVYPHSSRVMLLSNPDSLVNGTALGTEAKGIVKGEHGLGMLYDMVLRSDTLTAGDTVVTSGLGGDLPKSLVIGTVQDVRLSDDRLYQQASLASPVRFDALRFVFVIKNTPFL